MTATPQGTISHWQISVSKDMFEANLYMDCEDHFWPVFKVPSDQCSTCLRSASCTTKDALFDRLPNELQTRVCILADGAALKVFRQINRRYLKIATKHLFSTLVIDEARLDHIEKCRVLHHRRFRRHVRTLILDLPRNPAESTNHRVPQNESSMAPKTPAHRCIAARRSVLTCLTSTWPALDRLEIYGLCIFDCEPARLIAKQSATLRHLVVQDIKLIWPCNRPPTEHPANLIAFFLALDKHMKLETSSVQGLICDVAYMYYGWARMAETELQLPRLGPHFLSKVDDMVYLKLRLDHFFTQSPYLDPRPLEYEGIDDSWQTIDEYKSLYACPWLYQ